jgi:hypothetical protein
MRNIRRLVLGLVLLSLAGVSWGEDVLYCTEHGIAAITGKSGYYNQAKSKPITSIFKFTETGVQKAGEDQEYKIVHRSPSRVIAINPDAGSNPYLQITRAFITGPDGTFTFLDSSLADAELFASGGTCTKF